VGLKAVRLQAGWGGNLPTPIFIDENSDFKDWATTGEVVAWSLPRVETVNIDNE
jgi:hypothetical protein